MKNEAHRKEFPNADHVTMAPGRVLIHQKKCNVASTIVIPDTLSAEKKASLEPFDYIVQEVGPIMGDYNEPPCKPGDRVLLTSQAINQYVIAELGLFDKDQRIRVIVLPFDQIQGTFDEK